MRKPNYSGYLECCQQEIDGKRTHTGPVKKHDVNHKKKRYGNFGRKLLIALLILEICSWLSQEGYIVTEKGFAKSETQKKINPQG